MEEVDEKEILKGKTLEFLNEFESSEEREDDMKTLMPIWRDELLSLARSVGGNTESKMRTFMNVCEDYAGNRGMLERVRKEAEEIRILLDL